MELETQQSLKEEFFQNRCTEVASSLLGKTLVNRNSGTAGLIVETEAYLGKEDPACHYNANGGKRDQIFEIGPGTIYVYTIHGHECMNFICGSEDYPEGVLIRAVEPLKGIELMKERRGFEEETKLCSGPGKLVEAMEIRKERDNGKHIHQSVLELKDSDPEIEIEKSSRIGISDAEDWPLRYSVRGNTHVSKTVQPSDSSFEAHGFYRNID